VANFWLSVKGHFQVELCSCTGSARVEGLLTFSRLLFLFILVRSYWTWHQNPTQLNPTEVWL